MGYNILEVENLPETLRNKPRWVSIVSFAAALLIVTISAVAVGILLGYTYCYLEHRSQVNALKTGNISKSTNVQVFQVPYPQSEDAKYNRTINGAIMNSVIMTKILKIGQALLEDDMAYIPMDEHSSDGL